MKKDRFLLTSLTACALAAAASKAYSLDVESPDAPREAFNAAALAAESMPDAPAAVVLAPQAAAPLKVGNFVIDAKNAIGRIFSIRNGIVTVHRGRHSWGTYKAAELFGEVSFYGDIISDHRVIDNEGETWTVRLLFSNGKAEVTRGFIGSILRVKDAKDLKPADEGPKP